MRLRVAGVVVACLALASTAEAGRKSREPPTLAELAGREIAVDPTPITATDADKAARSYEDFLRIEGADPTLRAQALRRLGDLRLAEAEALAAEAGSQDARAGVAAEAAITAYRRLLDEQPGYAGRDAVLYQLARALEHTGDGAGALAILDRLVAAHPDSPHYAEAQFRRGETFFSASRYPEAERAYSAVVAGRDSEFAQQAQYKLAWSLFKQSRDAESNAAFLVLLDSLLAPGGSLRTRDELSRPEQELTDDALRALAITFAAAEGPESLRAALARHGATPYEARLYGALGDLYVEKERYQDAAETYRAFARRQPMDPEAPLLLVRAIDAYAKGGFTSLVLEGKREFVGQYGPRSEFWAARHDRLDPAVEAAIESNLLDLAQHHHALVQKGGPEADREEAIRWYREYLDGFDDTARAPATRLLLADLLFDGGRFEEAATHYERAAYGYEPASPDAARAGYAALVAYDKAQQLASGAARVALDARAIESSLRFADAFPGHAEVPGVLTRTTKALFDANDRERAESVAQRVLALGTRADAGQQLVAWTVLAHTYFDSARYVDAERAYAELSRRLPADDPLRDEAVERLAASVYRQAEGRRADGDVPGAVREFLRVAQVAPASPIRATAEFDAATLLLASGAWWDAAAILEAFRRNHPDHELQAEVTRKLAVAYVEDGRTAQAAVELERVAASEGEPAEDRRAALWQAAELYDSAGDVAGARRAYEAYVARFPAPYDAAIEARQELVRLAALAGDAPQRLRWLEDLVAADAAAGAARTERSRLLAADASLELARPLDASARAIRLTVPLDRSLLAKKSALESALAAYGRAATYGLAPITAAATYAMAELYRHLGAALLESERPRDLSAEELEQYDLLLEEQAFPFEEKAIGIHERNARLAAEDVYDESVQASFAALAELKPARYARVERDAGQLAGAVDLSQLEAALVEASASAGLLNRLGIAERRAGRFADARATYEQAIAADPLAADPELNLAILLDLYLQDPGAALGHYERFQALTGGADGEIASWLVELRTRLGQVQRTAETDP